MKAYERRAAGAYPFFGLGRWDDRMMLWRPVKGLHASEEAARAAARGPGRYRVSRVEDGGIETDGEPFIVTTSHGRPPFRRGGSTAS